MLDGNCLGFDVMVDSQYSGECYRKRVAKEDIETTSLNTLRPRQNGRRFPDDISKHIFLVENV